MVRRSDLELSAGEMFVRVQCDAHIQVPGDGGAEVENVGRGGDARSFRHGGVRVGPSADV